MDSTPARGREWEANFRQRMCAHLHPSESCGPPLARFEVGNDLGPEPQECPRPQLPEVTRARAPQTLVEGKPPARHRTPDVPDGPTSGSPTTRGVPMVFTEAPNFRKDVPVHT